MPVAKKDNKKGNDGLSLAKGKDVNMKMDVSYRDHSHIIGRSGSNITQIMGETQTQIHFPDSNRSNPNGMSNNVSLRGSLEDVEKARSLVRLSVPLIISFELPPEAPGSKTFDSNTKFVKKVEKQFEVQVIFGNPQKLRSTIVLVKGCEKDFKKTISATKKLIRFMYLDLAPQIKAKIRLEISSQHHRIVMGKDSKNLLEIMKRTGTTIVFPDADTLLPTKRFEVTIFGSVDGVHLARQQLQGNIPIALNFYVSSNLNIDCEMINDLMRLHDVHIQMNKKFIVTIMGIEKFVSNVYDARHQLLKLTSNKILADIPLSYYGPKDLASFKNSSIAEMFAGSTVKVSKENSQQHDVKVRKRVDLRSSEFAKSPEEKLPISRTNYQPEVFNPYPSPALRTSRSDIGCISQRKTMSMMDLGLNEYRLPLETIGLYPQTPIRYNGSLAPGDERKAFQKSLYNRMFSNYYLIASHEGFN